MAALDPRDIAGTDLTDRERQVLEAVVRTYVDTAEPAGSRTVSRVYDLGVSAATVRNTMSDLEEKGYLFHPHTSAGRIPTDLAYRFFVDRLMEPHQPSARERALLEEEIERSGASAVEMLVRQATRAMSLISNELGVAVAPRVGDAYLERLELIKVSSNKVLLVATIRGGLVRTVYADFPVEIDEKTLLTVTGALNERLAGLTFSEIRQSLPERHGSKPSHGGVQVLPSSSTRTNRKRRFETIWPCRARRARLVAWPSNAPPDSGHPSFGATRTAA